MKTAKAKENRTMDEEQALIEKAKVLMEKAKRIREQKILKAGKAAEVFHKSSDIDALKKELVNIFG